MEFYPDSVDALARIAARLPVVALSNGNADLQRIGIDQHFAFQLDSREHGAAKPEASIFLAACARLGLEPDAVLHVGDHHEMDIAGASRAGLRSCCSTAKARPDLQELRPDLEFDSLAALADWLDATPIPSHGARCRMTLPNGFTDTSVSALPLHVLERDGFTAWRDTLAPALQAWVDAQHFSAAPGALILLPCVHPDEKLGIAAAAIGIGDPLDPFSMRMRRWPAAGRLGAGLIAGARSAQRPQLGWGLVQLPFRSLQAAATPAGALAASRCRCRSHRPAGGLRARARPGQSATEHMGPEQLETVARELAEGSRCADRGDRRDELLSRNFPATHAVGRASHRAPV